MTARSAVREAVIEGSLREVGLADVMQLLDLGRRTGLLRLDDPETRRAGRVLVVGGRVRGALVLDATELPPDEDRLVQTALAIGERCTLECLVELLTWTAGRFAVDPLDERAFAGGQRTGLGIEAILLEAARRADDWAALADRVAGRWVRPRLVHAGDGRVSLAPDDWAILAYADGAADIGELAVRLGHDALAVARRVHSLVGAGLLVADDAMPHGRVPAGASRSSES